MMDPGTVVAIAAVSVTVIGGGIKWVRGRFAELKRKVETLEQAADKQDEVIADLKSQRDRLQITAELQDRFFGHLPPKRRESRD